jgi:hypothetical protein
MSMYNSSELALVGAASRAINESTEPCPFLVSKQCTTGPTRGERNRNPANIERDDTQWQGLATDHSLDDRFCVFTDLLYGVRALATVLLTYQRVHGLKTSRQIIHRWAAAKHTYTASSASVFASRVGCNPDAELDLEHPAVLSAVIRAIIKHENGRVTCRGVIADAVRLALA